MRVTAPGIQVEREAKGEGSEPFDLQRDAYYVYRFIVGDVHAPPRDSEGLEIDDEDVPTFHIIQALEEAGQFDYLDQEEDIYSPDDGEPLT